MTSLLCVLLLLHPERRFSAILLRRLLTCHILVPSPCVEGWCFSFFTVLFLLCKDNYILCIFQMHMILRIYTFTPHFLFCFLQNNMKGNLMFQAHAKSQEGGLELKCFLSPFRIMLLWAVTKTLVRKRCWAALQLTGVLTGNEMWQFTALYRPGATGTLEVPSPLWGTWSSSQPSHPLFFCAGTKNAYIFHNNNK